MVSFSKQTERRRRMRLRAQGKNNPASRGHASTPPFPIHPEGYDASAADAKRPEKPQGKSK